MSEKVPGIIAVECLIQHAAHQHPKTGWQIGFLVFRFTGKWCRPSSPDAVLRAPQGATPKGYRMADLAKCSALLVILPMRRLVLSSIQQTSQIFVLLMSYAIQLCLAKEPAHFKV